MKNRGPKDDPCGDGGIPGGCCKVEAIVAIDERGQMVVPKELRERCGIRPGDKFAMATWEQDGKFCCITLVKVEDLSAILKDRLSPVMKEA